MFTGIIEYLATVESITPMGSGLTFQMSSPLAAELKVDQSLSHDGVCLTVEAVREEGYAVTAIRETLAKTTLGHWKHGGLVNLERCLAVNGRLDGHMVQGHVDATGTCESVRDLNGSWEYRFSFDPEFAALVVEKGSICLNGISLTVFDVTRTGFSVGVIPYTYEHTNIRMVTPGASVNLEFDLLGKYIRRIVSLKE